jgi:hypothetical protein
LENLRRPLFDVSIQRVCKTETSISFSFEACHLRTWDQALDKPLDRQLSGIGHRRGTQGAVGQWRNGAIIHAGLFGQEVVP